MPLGDLKEKKNKPHPKIQSHISRIVNVNERGNGQKWEQKDSKQEIREKVKILTL